MNSTMEPLHVPEEPITRSKTKKIQDMFTLHLQKLATSYEATNNLFTMLVQ